MLIFIKTVFDGLQSQPIGWGQPKKMLRTVDGPLLRVVTKAYHLHMFLSLANLNIQKSLKHSNTDARKNSTEYSRTVFSAHAESRVSQTATPNRASPSPPPAPERTSTNRSLNMQTEKDVKEPNSASKRGVLCAQGARMRDASQSAWNTEFASSFSLYRQIHTKLCQNTHLGEYPQNTVVMS